MLYSLTSRGRKILKVGVGAVVLGEMDVVMIVTAVVLGVVDEMKVGVGAVLGEMGVVMIVTAVVLGDVHETKMSVDVVGLGEMKVVGEEVAMERTSPP